MVESGCVVGEPEHLVDDPVVRHAQAEGQATVGDGLDRQGLLGQGDGVAWLHRHHRRPDLDAGGGGRHHGRRGQRVELVGDLGDPDRGESRLLGPLGVRLQAGHLGRVHRPRSGPTINPMRIRGSSPPGAAEMRTAFYCGVRHVYRTIWENSGGHLNLAGREFSSAAGLPGPRSGEVDLRGRRETPATLEKDVSTGTTKEPTCQ